MFCQLVAEEAQHENPACTPRCKPNMPDQWPSPGASTTCEDSREGVPGLEAGDYVRGLPTTPRRLETSPREVLKTEVAPATSQGRPSDATVPPSPEDVLEDWDIEEQEPETQWRVSASEEGDFLMPNMPAFLSDLCFVWSSCLKEPRKNPMDWIQEETPALSCEPLLTFDFGFLMELMTDPFGMCKATGDFVGALPTSQSNSVSTCSKTRREASSVEVCLLGDFEMLNPCYSQDELMCREVDRVLFRELMTPFLEGLDMAQFRASCREFRDETKDIFHTTQELLFMMEQGDVLTKLRACRCLRGCDQHLGDVHDRMNKLVTSYYRHHKRDLCEEHLKEVRAAKRALKEHMPISFWEQLQGF